MLDIKNKNDRLTLVLGMHRSGTSLLTRGLMTLGLDLGANLMPPEADNPKGFWEDLDIVNLNETIINRFSSWSQITPSFESLQLLVPREDRVHAIDVISEKLRNKQLQAIKDPRLCILLPFWQDILRTCGCIAHNIVTIRNPMEVALSLQKRNNLPIEQGLLLWQYYNLHCLKEINNEFLVVSFQELLENPETELSRIGDFLQVQYTDSQIQDFVNDVIEKGLRHNKSTISISEKDTQYATEINALYTQLLKESKNSSTSAQTFRQSANHQFSLLRSPDLYENFSFDFAPSNKITLVLNSGRRITARNEPHDLEIPLTTAPKNIVFDLQDQSDNGLARIELPSDPCIIKILHTSTTLANGTTHPLSLDSGNFCIDFDNLHVFHTSSPYWNLDVNNETRSIRIQYEIINHGYETIKFLKAYDSTNHTDSHLSLESDYLARLFIGVHGIEFNSKDAITERIDLNTSILTFDLSDYAEKEISLLRLNPCNNIATVNLHACTIEYMGGASFTIPANSIQTNAIISKDLNYIFLSNDSCIDFYISKDRCTGIRQIMLHLTYIHIGHQGIEDIGKSINEMVNQQKILLANKDKTITALGKQVSDLNDQFSTNYLVPLYYQRQANTKKHKSQKFLRIIRRLKYLFSDPSREINYYRNRKIIAREGMFDEHYYLKNNIDLLPECIDTFRHFYFEGWKEGRNPCADFEIEFYLKNNPDVKASGVNPLVHYLCNGKNENRFTSKIHKHILTIEQSGLFDRDWYLDQYPLTKSVESIRHYCLYGCDENKSPYPLFDTNFYHQEYCRPEENEHNSDSPDKINPLVHYILKGKERNNRTYDFTRDSILRLLPKLRHKDIYNVVKDSNLLLEDYYVTQLEDNCEDPVTHYISTGFCLNLKPNPFFDNVFYIEQFPELKSYNVPPLLHYTLFGSKTGATPCHFFDPGFYNKYYTNVTDLGIDPLAHFLTWGWKEWRRPRMDFFTPFFVYSSTKSIESIEDFTNCLVTYSPPNLDANSYPNYSSWYSEDSPDVSIILLNWNKTFLTIDCLISLWEFTSTYKYEVIIVDNGSNPLEKHLLNSFSPYVTIIDLDTNRFYGEGNNIGVEHSKGDYVVLLNNDTIVTENWLAPLIDGLNSKPDIGVTGAKLLFPDGTIQEMGAFVDADGNIDQKCKHTPNNKDYDIQEVDYCSGACLAIRKTDFLQILGFDYTWEPAYYEDNDLCWKIKLLGKRVIVVPESEVYHLEHVSISNQQELNFTTIIEQNKKKFLARWKEYITDKKYIPNLVLDYIPTEKTTAPNRPNAVIYTPFPLLLGGGERYLLTIAEYLQSFYNVYLVLPELYSRLRILTIGRDLGLHLNNLQILKFDELKNTRQDFALSIVMGNEILPQIPAIAKKNIFHCQFPFRYDFEEHGFQRSQVENYNGYDCILVNSQFTKFNIHNQQSEYSLKKLPTYIAYPPVGEFETGNVDHLLNQKEDRQILSIGRFFVGGHNKKHNFLIEAFKSLVDEYGHDAQLNLVGGTHTENIHRKYLDQLQKQATGYNIRFHLDLASEGVGELLKASSIYWHATGIDVDPVKYPEAMEHFGITPVEAMKACCIPIVPNKGGVCEIVRGCSDQILTYRNKREIIQTTHTLFNLKKSEIVNLRKDVLKRSNEFGKDRFIAQLQDVINTVLNS